MAEAGCADCMRLRRLCGAGVDIPAGELLLSGGNGERRKVG